MNEASKIKARLMQEGTFDKYITGRVLDIGCGRDKITPNADPWDLAEGDAQML